MRFAHPDGTVVHLAYCSNVHPAEDLEGLREQLRRFAGPVRSELGVDRLGLGLWLPAQAAATLAADPAELDALRAELDAQQLEIVTLNAFPYGGFHAARVKHNVYYPDWTEPDRLDYTRNAARVLARLLPDDAARGSISTLPLAWREPWDPERRRAALANLDELALDLARLRDATGRHIRIGLEPEPGCIVETAADAAHEMEGVDTDYIGVCMDTCHLATEFDEADQALAALQQAGLPVVKTQLSNALQVSDPANGAGALADFAEDRFLHQVREAGGFKQGLDDLPEALAPAEHGITEPLPATAPWRVHFHLPLHSQPAEPLQSTEPVLEGAMGALLGGPQALTDHCEVETYTWSVLPPQQRPAGDAGLISGLAAELDHARQRMHALGLEDA